MMLAISQKSSYTQPGAKPELRDSLTTIKQAIQAFEQKNKHRAIKALSKAYFYLPRTCQGIEVCADIIESLLQIEAFQEAAALAPDIEKHYAYGYFQDPDAHFNLFRIFSNLAQAHHMIGRTAYARRLKYFALDHQLEISDTPDLEMIRLLLS